MDLLVNDISLAGQFAGLSEFRVAIGHLMSIRELSLEFGRELRCNRGLVNSKVTREIEFPQAVQSLSLEECRSIMQWLTRAGPFWDDDRAHGPNDYLECRGDVVTDTAVGEAAYVNLRGGDSRLASLNPSSWTFSPIAAREYLNDAYQDIAIENYWERHVLEQILRAAERPISSWTELERRARSNFDNLVFSDDAFSYLRGHPFVKSASDRFVVLFGILNKFKSCFDSEGQRTAEGHQIYQMHFTGERAHFSDSSATEKSEFAQEMSFTHPTEVGRKINCTWHGKVKTPQMRVHFTWPVRADSLLYIPYVGPKITKR